MSIKKPTINICLSPALYPFYAQEGNIVVMVDAIRASASITTALMNGVTEIIPFSDKDKTFKMREKGYVIAGERNSEKIPKFDFGNSPFNFTRKNINGKKLAFTTTNGTRALGVIAENKITPAEILIGSFLNISELSNYLLKKSKNILVLCSGWKNGVNIEDSYFAGRLTKKLNTNNDFRLKEAAELSVVYAGGFKNSSYDTIMQLSPRLSQKKDRLEKDFRYCLQEDITNVIPIFENNKITAL